MNLYGFAGGDPLNFSDPFGLNCIDKDRKPVPCPPGQDAALKADEKGITPMTATPVEAAAVLAVVTVPAAGLIEGGIATLKGSAADAAMSLQVTMIRNPVRSAIAGFSAGVASSYLLAGTTVPGAHPEMVAGTKAYQAGFKAGKFAALAAKTGWEVAKTVLY